MPHMHSRRLESSILSASPANWIADQALKPRGPVPRFHTVGSYAQVAMEIGRHGVRIARCTLIAIERLKCSGECGRHRFVTSKSKVSWKGVQWSQFPYT